MADFQKLTPDFDYAIYFKDVKIRHFDTLDVATPEFFKALNDLIAKEPIDAWKSYFRWHTLHGLASNLPKAFFDENFAFFGKTLAGQKEPTPRWKQCTQHDRPRTGRGRGAGLGEGELPAGRQGEHGSTGGRSGEERWATTSRPCPG